MRKDEVILEERERGEEEKKRRSEERRQDAGRPTTSHEDISISRLYKNHQRGLKRLATGTRETRVRFQRERAFQEEISLGSNAAKRSSKIKNA